MPVGLQPGHGGHLIDARSHHDLNDCRDTYRRLMEALSGSLDTRCGEGTWFAVASPPTVTGCPVKRDQKPRDTTSDTTSSLPLVRLKVMHHYVSMQQSMAVNMKVRSNGVCLHGVDGARAPFYCGQDAWDCTPRHASLNISTKMDSPSPYLGSCSTCTAGPRINCRVPPPDVST